MRTCRLQHRGVDHLKGLALGLRLAEAGGDHGHADVLAHAFVVHRTEDNVRVFCRESANGVHDFVHFLHLQAAGGRDVDQHTLGAGKIDPFQQWRGHGLFGSDACAIDAGRVGRAHHRHAHLAHHRAHVLEVDVDQAGEVDDFGNAADGVAQHVVRGLEGLVHRDVVAEHFHQLVVEDDDQRIDILLQLGDAGFSHLHALAFEAKGFGDHGHGQDAHFAGHLGNDRRGAGARAAAHAGSDEGHVRPLQRLGDALALLKGSAAAGFRFGASTQTAFAQRHLDDGAAAFQGLRVGVGGDEIDTVYTFANHVIDGIAAGAADADDLDHGAAIVNHFFDIDDFKHGGASSAKNYERLISSETSKNSSQTRTSSCRTPA